MGYPRISGEIKKYTKDWMRLVLYSGQQIDIEEIEHILWIALDRKEINRIPGKRMLYNYREEAIEEYDKLPEIVKKNLEEMGEPWSLESLDRHYIPPEALPTVLRVWKYFLALGHTFTVRDAKWVARLQSIEKDTFTLSAWVTFYSLREYMSEIQGKRPVTSDLDTVLIMGRWEYATCQWMGKVKPLDRISMGPFVPSTPRGFGDSTSSEAAKAAELSFISGLEQPTSISISDLSDLGLTEEAQWVYTHWLVHLRKGPKWITLSREKREEIVLRLRQWIGNHPWSDYWKLPFEGIGTESLYRFFPNFEEATTKQQFKPSDLLKEVGYGGAK